MNTRRFWQSLETFGISGGTLADWRSALRESDLVFVRRWLVPSDHLAWRILDPDDPTQFLEVTEDENDSFTARSEEIPAHRKPLCLCRADLVEYRLDLDAFSEQICEKLGFTCSPRRP